MTDARAPKPVCVCDPPRFVHPACTLHGAHEYHGAPKTEAPTRPPKAQSEASASRCTPSADPPQESPTRTSKGAETDAELVRAWRLNRLVGGDDPWPLPAQAEGRES